MKDFLSLKIDNKGNWFLVNYFPKIENGQNDTNFRLTAFF